MASGGTISRKKPGHLSLDFEALRKEGLEHIQRLAGNTWTDYNLHDPGVTLLEVLCYALTDLGYRTESEIKDILESGRDPEANSNYDLFTAAKILPNNPLTTNDLRKLIIDCPGIRNAWVEIDQEEVHPFYYRPKSHSLAHAGQEQLIPNGLYQVLLEFEEIPAPPSDFEGLDDLNANSAFWYANELEIVFSFPFWDELPQAFKMGQPVLRSKVVLNNPLYDREEEDWKDHFVAVISLGFPDNLPDEELVVNLRVSPEDRKSQEVHQRVSNLLPLKFWEDGEEKNTLLRLQYYGWNELFEEGMPTHDITDIRLTDLRGSSTNSMHITAMVSIGSRQYELRADAFSQDGELPVTDTLKLILKAELENLEADAPFPFRFSLEKRLREVLNPGNAQGILPAYRDKVFSINKIVETVRQKAHAHRNLSEDFSDFKVIRQQEVALELALEVGADVATESVLIDMFRRLEGFFNPQVNFYSLEEALEKITYPDEVFEGPLLDHGFILDEELDQLSHRETIYASDLVGIIMKNDHRIQAVKGLKLSNFIKNRPLQQDQEDVLELTAPHLYKPRLSLQKSRIYLHRDQMRWELDTNQKKAILQHLSDKREVLEMKTFDLPVPRGERLDIENYFSLQQSLPLTYGIGEDGLPASATTQRKAQARQLKGYLMFFDQLLANQQSQLQHLRELFSFNATGKHATYAGQLMDGVPGIAELLLDFDPRKESWEAFVANPENAFLKKLQAILEGPEQQLNRKGQILDHLLARFGEKYTDSGIYHADHWSAFQEASGHHSQQLLSDKMHFLRSLPALSSQRSKGLNYLQPDIAQLFDVLPVTIVDQTRYHFRLIGKDGKELLKSHQPFTDEAAAKAGVETVMTLGTKTENYTKVFSDDQEVKFLLHQGDQTLAQLTLDRRFDDDDQCLREFINFLGNRHDVWDTSNVSGLEKRIAARLGIRDFKRKTLHLRKRFQGLEWNGFSDYIKVDEPERIHFSEYTVSAWVKPERKEEEEVQTLFCRAGDHFCIQIHPEGFLRHRFYNASSQEWKDQDSLPVIRWNEWMHIAVTNNGLSAKIVVDGEVLASTFVRGIAPPSSALLFIGGEENQHLFKGRISDLQLWGFALSVESLKMDMQRLPKSSTYGLLASWNFGLDTAERYPELLLQGLLKPFSEVEGPGQGEGFHLLEHILLRPEGEADKFLDLPEPTDEDEGWHDPYSFQITMAFPNWIGRFTDPDFRAYAQQVIDLEVPAWIMVNVLWLDNEGMRKFEESYRPWLVDKAAIHSRQQLPEEGSRQNFTATKNALIETLNLLNQKDHQRVEVQLENIKARKEASSIQDLEYLLSQEFHELREIRIINRTDQEDLIGNGLISIVVVAYNQDSKEYDLEPELSLERLAAMRDFLLPYLPGDKEVELEVINPRFEQVLIEFEVTFQDGLEDEKYLNILHDELNQFLTPWAWFENQKIEFGGSIRRSSILKFLEDRLYIDQAKFSPDQLKLHKVEKGADSEGIGKMILGEDFNVIGDLVTKDLETVSPTDPMTVLSAAPSHSIMVKEIGIGHYAIGLNFVIGKAVGPGVGTMIIGDDFILKD